MRVTVILNKNCENSVTLEVHRDPASSGKSARKTPQDTSEKDHGRVISVARKSD